VGERNKKYFYWYLWAQLILISQLTWLGYTLVRYCEGGFGRVLGIVTLVVGGLFILFILNLIVFTSVLISRNVTTWECLSWKKISYLHEWPKKAGSPWNFGFCGNLAIHLCYKEERGDFFLWKMPNYLPSIN
jgi:palmitoyltransferase